MLASSARTCGSTCLPSCAGATGLRPCRSWECSCREVRFSTPILRQDAPISLPGRGSPGAPRYRASGLVQWHEADALDALEEGPLSNPKPTSDVVRDSPVLRPIR